jgi:hypothetical protein
MILAARKRFEPAPATQRRLQPRLPDPEHRVRFGRYVDRG